MIEPFLDSDRAGRKPSRVQAGHVVATAVAVAMPVVVHVLDGLCGSGRVQEEVSLEGQQAAPAHEQAAAQQHARDAEGAQALDLAKTRGEGLARGLEAPGDCCQRQDIGGEVCQAVPRVGDQSLGAESVAACALGKGRGEVGEEADSCDADAGVVLVVRGEIHIIVVVMVMAVVAVAPFLVGAHDGVRSD